MPNSRINLWDHVGLGLILEWQSGVMLSNQTGGTNCLAPEIEGVFIPLLNDVTEKDHILISPENDLYSYFTGPKWQGTGATCGIDGEDADFIDHLLAKVKLSQAIRVDRDRLTESHEAWIYVLVSGEESGDLSIYSGFDPYPRRGVITWQNSD